MAQKKSRTPAPPKPAAFIGSSAEAIKVAQALAVEFEHDYIVRLWPGTFPTTEDPITQLERSIGGVDFGVFVFAADDTVQSRGARTPATRDNTILEFGMAIGKLTRLKSFVVVPKSQKKLKMPSDLNGFNTFKYDDEVFKTEPRTAMAPAATHIRHALAVVQQAVAPRSPSPPPEPNAAGTAAPPGEVALIAQAADCGLLANVADLLGMIGRGNAGLAVSVIDDQRFRRWTRTLLEMALNTLKAITQKPPADLYTVWLRPRPNDGERLDVFEAAHLPADYPHYTFGKGEGMAGTVWATGQAGSHSADKPHPQWRHRTECRNASYVCVPVGAQGGSGGVLGFGSNGGFQVTPQQAIVLSTFAAVLSMSYSPATSALDGWTDPNG